MSSGTGRAFGKIILCGEHAVVYGVPALAAGIDRGALAEATSAEEDRVVFSAEEAAGPRAPTDLERALGLVRASLGIARPFRVHLTTDLPAAAGLGCSAALGVATARALLAAEGRADEQSTVLAAAHAWETVFHGNPSGIDATVAALGGALSYIRGEPAEPVVLPSPLRFAVGHTGLGSSTKSMVEGVARLRERARENVDRTFAAITSVSRNLRLALEAGDRKAVGQLLDMCQMLLAGLFVSTTEIETLCRLARAAGALGAKLTGAGGGGCVIALVEDDAAPVLSAWAAAGFAGFSTELAASPRASLPLPE